MIELEFYKTSLYIGNSSCRFLENICELRKKNFGKMLKTQKTTIIHFDKNLGFLNNKKKNKNNRFGALRPPFEPIYSASGVKKYARFDF